MTMLTVYKTPASDVTSPLSLLTTALVTITISALALLALLKLLLTILPLLAVRTLMALPKTSLSVSEIPRSEPLMIPLLGTLVTLPLPLSRLCPTGTISPCPALMAGLS